MGLQNVKDHDHVFPTGRAWDSDDESCRFDAIEFEDGTFAVYSADKREVVMDNLPSFEEARATAQDMANARAKLMLK